MPKGNWKCTPHLSPYVIAVYVFLTLCHITLILRCYVGSHPTWNVGENRHYRQRREKLQCNWLEGDTSWLDVGYLGSVVSSSFPCFIVVFLIVGWMGHRLWEHHHSVKSPAPVVSFWLCHCCPGDHTTPKMHRQRDKIFFLMRPCPLLQEAVAQGFEREYKLFGSPDSYFQQLPALLLKKREKLASSLRTAGFKPIMPEGGYFLTADISCLSKFLHQFHFGRWWQIKVAFIRYYFSIFPKYHYH